jgi:SAM-dependent methyltransferase
MKSSISMMGGPPEMQTYYAGRASYYDDVYLKPERAADMDWLRQHLPARLAGRSILEVACGTGYWTQHLASVASRMIALDLTPEPLALAKSRAGVERVDFHQMDAYSLPAKFSGFDGAFAGLWFSHVPIGRRCEFLRGLHACLSADARIVLIDNSLVQTIEHPLVETDAEGNTYQQRPLRDGSTHRVLKNFPPEAELRASIGPLANHVVFTELENFWVLEYELASVVE